MLHLWKFYYKLSKNQLPTYFDVMIPMLPNICNIYNIRHPTFHLPSVKHDFAEQRMILDYQLIKLLNPNESTVFTLKAQSLFFYGFKTFIIFDILLFIFHQ